jgi:hypothetical protein
MAERRLCTRGDIITRADFAVERWPARRAEANCDGVDELVTVWCGSDTELVELVRRPIAAYPAARGAELGIESFGGRLDDAVVIEPMVERTRAQPRR